jgi:hypothetical protein
LKVIEAPHDDLQACLEVAKVCTLLAPTLQTHPPSSAFQTLRSWKLACPWLLDLSSLFKVCSPPELKYNVQVADIVAFVVGPALVAGGDDGFIDQAGKRCLSMLRAQGLPVTTGLLLVMLSITTTTTTTTISFYIFQW